MKPEYEARFLAIDADAVLSQLRSYGATNTMPQTLMRRIVFKTSDIDAHGDRLRDEGHRTTLTY